MSRQHGLSNNRTETTGFTELDDSRRNSAVRDCLCSMRIACQLALDILEIDLVPPLGHFAINVSAARMDVVADLPPSCGYTHDLRPVGSADIQIRFDDVVSLKAHSDDKNTFIGKRRIDLPPERLKRFRSARVSDRFQFMKAGV